LSMDERALDFGQLVGAKSIKAAHRNDIAARTRRRRAATD
jgi:hypothetical protein